MCKRIKIWAMVCVLSTLALLSGCEQKVYQYPFEQVFSNVVKVEVCRYYYATNPENDYVTLVTELDSEKAEALLKDISELPCYKHFGDFPMGSYGEIILYISYANEEAEVVGMVNSASVRIDGEWWVKAYYFDSKHWSAVLTEYVDVDLVPELKKYLE